MAPSPSAAVWPRARVTSSGSRSDWMPSEMRFTPAARRPAQSGVSRALGLASTVTSVGSVPHRSTAASTRATTAAADRSDGVPPPK